MIKKCLINWFGEVWFCRMFHTAYGKKNKWYCDKCNLTYDKRLSDNNLGPG